MSKQNKSEKIQQLESEAYVDPQNKTLTSSLGVKVEDNQNSLRIGSSGPTLLEDFLLRDKLIHFDRERIPERVVHARGVGAHGYFEAYQGNEKWTKAHFLTHSDIKTPIFVRISTVQGGRGSADVVRDVRGFSIKFYTQEGNYDLVGNNIPVFFIQDAIKFPDFVHAVKPEDHNEIPTGQSAHDTFWDFVSLNTEAAHMTTWVMSDRAIPRNLRSIQGFGVHTFRLINDKNEAFLVKFHWTPKQGVAQVVWDEALKLNGKDPDFHRRDLWDAIEKGNYPEWELGAQIFTEEQALEWEFDVLDPTKLVPEELVPVTPLGKFVLNRNPDEFFAETEQVAFSPANIVSGIDFSNDPLLQGRLFSYTDTHLHRLGTPNFNQISINKPVCPFHTNRRGGFANQHIHKGKANYEPNSVDNNYPREATDDKQAFTSYPEKVQGSKLRVRAESFADHFSQATLHYRSLSKHEQQHMKDAYAFELSKVQAEEIRQRVVSELLSQIDEDLAHYVANELGLNVEKAKIKSPNSEIVISKKLSIDAFPALDIAQRKIAVLVHDGANATTVNKIKKWAEENNAIAEVLAPSAAPVKSDDDQEIKVDGRQNGEPSVTYDAIVVVDGNNFDKFKSDGVAKHYVLETYKHLKPIVLVGDKSKIIEVLNIKEDQSVFITEDFLSIQKDFKNAIQQHRNWDREEVAKEIPA
ncbi:MULTISPECIES: catalase [unclassified Acinetobacter]|uniref:catalase n=1 Tax=unclassified Acinetobacter TaxID=196816 RepID=UPI0025774471|nr:MULTISPECIES: catalase [unclassified Acinetobacter]MDM1764625.1 catalase [Acinetobacter sp. 226-1]MDM1768621.1 catalase [Acinetobacter sp. 226-4]